MVASYVTGIPHPPGYPLYTMIGKLFTLIPFNSVAWRMNFSSALFDGLCCLFVFLTIEKVTKNPFPSFCGSFSLAFSKFFWHYSEVADVFPLNNLFVSLLIYILVLWRDDIRNNKENSKLYIFSFLFGLSLTNHHTMLLLVPGFVFFIFYTHKKMVFQWKSLLLCFFLSITGLVPYIYLPIAASYSPPLNWKNPTTAERFKATIFREQYGSMALVSNKTLEEMGIEASHPGKRLSVYFIYLYSQFTLAGIIFAIGGLWKRDSFLIFLLLSFIFTGPFFALLANIPLEIPLFFGVIHRFYVMSSVIFAFIAGLGADVILNFIKNEKFKIPAGAILVMAISLPPFICNMEEADFRNNYLDYDYGKNILDSLPENSILFLKGDLPSLAIDYLQMVEGYRTDVTVIDQVKLHYDWYGEQIKKRFPQVVIPGEKYDREKVFNINLIEANINKFPIFFTDFEERSFEKKYKEIPWGLVRKVVPLEEDISREEIIKTNKNIVKNYNLRGLDVPYPLYSWEEEIKRQYDIKVIKW